jgi:DNA-binding LacI/PurR family transcriptional regulator
MPRKRKPIDDAPAASPPRPARTQMSDIARLAGVSVSAVSRALSGKLDIGEETRKRIVELARSLNYTVNVGASNLRLKQNRTVAVVMPFMHSVRQQLTEPFFISLISSIANALTDRGLEMLLSRVEENHKNFAEPYYAGRALGMIFTGQWLDHDELNTLALNGVPFAIWGEKHEQQMYCTVGTDNVQGGMIATEHLLSQGAKRIAIIGDFGSHELKSRHEGYLLAHKQRGIEPDPRLFINTSFDSVVARQDIQALVDSGVPFDGVFACSDLTAMTTINVLIAHGINVPSDVAVVGYDDIELSSYYRPALTTIRQPIDAAGRALVDALMEQIEGKRPVPRKLVTELVVRDSTRHEK